MRLPLFMLLFAVALLVTALTIYTGLKGRSEARTGVVLSAAGLGVCGLVTMSAFQVVTVSGGQEFTYSYPTLAIVGVIAGAVNVFALFKSSVEEFGGDL